MKEASIRGAAQVVPLHLLPLRAAINTSHPAFSSAVTSYQEALQALLEETFVLGGQFKGLAPGVDVDWEDHLLRASERIRPDPR